MDISDPEAGMGICDISIVGISPVASIWQGLATDATDWPKKVSSVRVMKTALNLRKKHTYYDSSYTIQTSLVNSRAINLGNYLGRQSLAC